MSKGRNEAMLAWFMECPHAGNVYFNFSEWKDESTMFATNDVAVKKYLGGSSKRQFYFHLIAYRAADGQTPNSPINAQMMDEVEQIGKWVEAQNKTRNFPDFPEGCAVQSVEVLSSAPSVSGNQEIGAKYLMSCRVTYLQQEG